jgi:4-amino-4-deoxy-L-arabinose transferase-like glycosyltransferase
MNKLSGKIKSLCVNTLNSIKSDKKNYYIIGLLLIGIAIRIFFIGKIPPGLNQDEASIGYDTYALLHYGIDRHGFHNPVHFISWGSGQNALYAYLSMPFIALFGLSIFSVRLLAALIGCISLFVFYKIARKLWDKDAAIILLFALVINPWHIMISRWALESNLFPSVFLIGIYFLVTAREKKWALPVSFFVFSLSLYSYGTSYFFVPIFIGLVLLVLYFIKKEKISLLAISVTVFVVVAIPIFLFVLGNTFQWKSIENVFFSIPRLTDTPRFNTVSSFFSYNFIHQSITNLKNLLKLFFSQDDGYIWNSIPAFGFMYLFSLPFFIAGLYHVFAGRKNIGYFYPVLMFWLVLAFLLGSVTDININRINILFYILILFAGLGLYELKGKSVVFFRTSIAVYTLFFLLFGGYYFIKYPGVSSSAFMESLGDAIVYAKKNTPPATQIHVTETGINMPYIFVLFYAKETPETFNNSVVYPITGGPAKSFGRYVFETKDTINTPENTYIIHNSELQHVNNQYFSIKKFKHFSVATPK